MQGCAHREHSPISLTLPLSNPSDLASQQLQLAAQAPSASFRNLRRSATEAQLGLEIEFACDRSTPGVATVQRRPQTPPSELQRGGGRLTRWASHIVPRTGVGGRTPTSRGRAISLVSPRVQCESPRTGPRGKADRGSGDPPESR